MGKRKAVYTMKLEDIDKSCVPAHVAIIMDGN